MSTSERNRRRAAAAEIRERQRRAERNRWVIILGAAVVVAAAIIGSVLVVIANRQDQSAAIDEAAAGEISGVQEYPNLSRNHVEGVVDYPQIPGAGGDHAPVWANCGAYDTPVVTEQAVHSLEHGAVWVAHSPDLAAEDVERLALLADRNGFVLVSPVADIPAPVVVTAWGTQLALDGVDDERLAPFVEKYVQGPQTPEPGAPCTGGVGAA